MGCKLLTPCTNTSRSTSPRIQDERCPFPSSALHQLEEAMKYSSNHSAKLSDGEGKPKSPHETPEHAQDRHRGHPTYKKQALSILPEFTMKRQINEILHYVEAPDQRNLQHYQTSTIGQAPKTTPAQSFTPRVRGILLLPRRKETSDHPLLGPLDLEELVKQNFLKEYILTPEAASGHLNNKSSQDSI